MHQGKRFVLVRHDYWDVADDAEMVPWGWGAVRRAFRHVPARWKRSRHRTRADRYCLTEAHVDCCGPHPTHNAPKWARQERNRLYRARSRHLVRIGQYDLLVPPKRDAAWHYW